jgi:hypothetical protein
MHFVHKAQKKLFCFAALSIHNALLNIWFNHRFIKVSKFVSSFFSLVLFFFNDLICLAHLILVVFICKNTICLLYVEYNLAHSKIV